MNHSEAIESQAVAAYLLGDLSGAERDAFEVHCIDCPICAEAVWSGTKMFAAGREALKSDKPKVLQFRPMNWMSARAVAATLAVVVGIQGFVIWNDRPVPSIEVPAQGPYFRSATRAEGESAKVIRFQDDQPIQFYVDIPPEQPFPRYLLEVRGSGKVLSDDVTEEQARSGDSIPLSVRPLPAGRYVLAIVGVRKDGNRSELASWNFVVQ
jgi:hypothetical protein